MDTSKKCTGGVLQQPAPPITVTISQVSLSTMNLLPVAYTSHKLTPTQQRYNAQEREALAIAQALQRLRNLNSNRSRKSGRHKKVKSITSRNAKICRYPRAL